MRRFAIALALLVAALPARADQLAAGLSTDEIRITSSFRGADVVIFGAVAEASRLGDLSARDIVVVLRGPVAPVTVRRKARIAGIWINADEARIDRMPGFYHLAATRPLAAVAPANVLEQLTLGALRLPASVAGDTTIGVATAFRDAAVRLRTRARLYGETTSVERLGPYLFRVRIRLPATVPPGLYSAETYLFERGRLVARQAAPLPIAKAGLERRLSDFATGEPLPYALATVAMALILGWLGYAVFGRRE
jgi:uncharacterized protein (TIGR02186 family)